MRMIAQEFFRNKKNLLALWCLLVFVISAWMGISKHERSNYKYTLSWDAEGYYLYLPAIFINDGFENLKVQNVDNNPTVFIFKPYPGTHKIFTKYTYGVALMEAPFFLIAHAYSKLIGGTTNYFLGPYMASVIVADAFYLALGMLFLGVFLLRYFSIYIVIFTQVVIWLGTNLLYYTSFVPGYSHTCSFFLIAALMGLTPLLYSRFERRYIVIASILLGLIVLIRPTDIVAVFFILLYDVYSRSDFKNRMGIIREKWRTWILFPVLGLIIFIPQFLYWRYLSGHYFLYSYQDEGFKYWQDPKLFSVLFSPFNGFFVFEPIMLLSIVGLIYCIKKRALSFWAVLAIFCTTDYICGSWWYWNFGAAYGFRPYIDFLPVLSLPMSFVLSAAVSWSLPARAILAMGIAVFLFLSIRLHMTYVYTWQGYGWGWNDIARIYREAVFIK